MTLFYTLQLKTTVFFSTVSLNKKKFLALIFRSKNNKAKKVVTKILLTMMTD